MSQSTNLDDLRRSMLFGRNSATKRNADDARVAMFEGRSVALQSTSVESPAAESSTDPHRLFQLLKKKKRMPHNLANPASSLQLNLQHVRPVPSDQLVSSARPMNSARPYSPVDRPTTIFNRTIHSASSSSANGRPATRQKHPKQSLDLFPSKALKDEENPFPQRFPTRRSSKDQAPQAVQKPSPKQGNNGVNFNCLFFTPDDDLDTNEEFPAPKAQAHIPLIETDWFTTEAWEQLPTGDGAAQVLDDDFGLEDGSDSQYAESLYELLVAQKKSKPCRPQVS
jgi:hypothetical protein